MISSLKGKPLASVAALRADVGTMPVGSELELGILRDGKPVSVSVVMQQSTQDRVPSATIYTGIEGAELSNYDAAGQKGVRIDSVKPGTHAAAIGLKKGDIILGVQ